ncbi:MAG: hypothetical protein M3O70_00860 [Actinomycetota bacterium]|nr:hypothetical protein [Actinomycetota bacterium]
MHGADPLKYLGDNFYTRAEVLNAARMIVQPTHWCHRVVESAEIHNRVLRRRLALDITIPADENVRDGKPDSKTQTRNPVGLDGHHRDSSGSSQRYLIPLMNVRKGYYIDNLDVRDDAGRSIPVLNRRFHNKFAGRMLASYSAALIAAEHGVHWQSIDEQLLLDLSGPYEAEIQALAGLATQWPKEAAKSYKRFFEYGGDSAEAFTDHLISPSASVLRRDESNWELPILAGKLAEGWFLLAELEASPGDHRIVKVSFDVNFIPTEQRGLAERMSRWLVELGLQHPSGFTGTAMNLRECQSYHFKMAAPAGYLLDSQSLVRPPFDDEPNRGNIVLKLPRSYIYEYHQRFGSSLAHIYACFDELSAFHKKEHIRADLTRIGVNVEFFPHPWGLVGQASLVGGLSAVALWWAFVNFGWLIASEASSAAVAALLALPATASTLMLRWSPVEADHLVRAPFRARALALATALLTAVAAVLMLAARADRPVANSASAVTTSSVAQTPTSAPSPSATVQSSPRRGALPTPVGAAAESARSGLIGRGVIAGLASVLTILSSLCIWLWFSSIVKMVRSARQRARATHGESV